ncbi:MAG: hypothetical protein ING59_18260 [Burkholderiales bacterium]|nr:hypothetical protein [Burkholderiales bacterium]
MKPAQRALPAAQEQISAPVQGVLRDVRHAFLGLCIDAGQKVRCEVDFNRHRIRCYALRRRQPTHQPLLCSIAYHRPNRPFKGKPQVFDER